MNWSQFRRAFPRLADGGGFTVIELMVCVAIGAIIASMVQPQLGRLMGKARDGRRVADAEAVTSALINYQVDHGGGIPPRNPAAAGIGEWEVSYLPAFLNQIAPYLSRIPRDPINRVADESTYVYFGRDTSHFYAYYSYDEIQATAWGCPPGPMSVFGVRQLESGMKPTTPRAFCGTIPPGGCPDMGIPNVCRDWSTEFDYSRIFYTQ